jgi:hypothetical protein
MIQVGDIILGSCVYGKTNKLVGNVVEIQEKTYLPQITYRGMDIITIKWNDSQIAKFNREELNQRL